MLFYLHPYFGFHLLKTPVTARINQHVYSIRGNQHQKIYKHFIVSHRDGDSREHVDDIENVINNHFEWNVIFDYKY